MPWGKDQRTGFTGYPLGRGLLMLVGMGCIGMSFADLRGGDPLALSGLSVGTLMVILAPLVPWIAEARADMRKGIRLKMRKADEVAMLTTQMATDPTPMVVSEDLDVIGARLLLAKIAITTLFIDNEVLPDCRFHLYLHDGKHTLEPVVDLEPRRADLLPAESWKEGNGVVGQAWQQVAFFRVVGDECWSELTPEQQVRYEALTAVAAIPLEVNDEPVGIISAATEVEDSALKDDRGYQELVLTRDLVTRVLVDVLKWFGDE